MGAGMNEWFENVLAAAALILTMLVLLSLPGY